MTELEVATQNRFEYERTHRVRRYHALLGSLPAELQKEREKILELAKTVEPIATKTLAKYTVNPLLPPVVRKLRQQIINICAGALTATRDNPQFIEKKLRQIRSRTPENFNGWSAETLAKEDQIALTPFLGNAAALEQFPQEIKRLEDEIERAEKEALKKEEQGQGHPFPLQMQAFSQSHETEKEVAGDFDPRI